MSVKAKKFVSEKGYYEILEVSSVATTNEIQRSFERLCQEYVDLKNDDPQIRKTSAETLYTITKAYETLTDPFQRMNYDDRKFGGKQNNNNDVEMIFREGLKASKASNSENAVRFFKEAVDLFPHRPVYRVNLAIAYFEHGNKDQAVKELRMALMLDPTSEFAQEVVAKLLFKVSDKKGLGGFFVNKANRQLVMLIAAVTLLSGTLYFGVPKLKGLYNSFMNSGTKISREEKAKILKSKLPEDLRQAINNSNSGNNKGSRSSNNNLFVINKLDPNFKPEGKIYDYSAQEATKKTYYKDQDMVIVDYKNGSILTYKPQDVIGWKKDAEKGIPVIISKANEIIPVQTNIPVTLSDGKIIKPGEPGFPARVFPEYESGMSDTETSNPAASPSPVTEISPNPATTSDNTDDSAKSNSTLDNPPPPPVNDKESSKFKPKSPESDSLLPPPPPPPNIDSSTKKN